MPDSPALATELQPQNPLSPVCVLPTDPAVDTPQKGVALCLSGGGYRAMLFHIGALWRLNELGYLPKLARISSVSGGSITAGVLGLHWNSLQFNAQGVAEAFERKVVDPVRALACETIDAPSILKGLFLPGTVSDKVAGAYRKHLFGRTTLQDLPNDPPRFALDPIRWTV